MKSDQVLHVPDILQNKLKINLKWTASVTIDISAILCDAEGTKVDSVYYKNKQSQKMAIELESITDESTQFGIELERIPEDVSSIWFVANIYRKSFEDVQNMSCQFFGNKD